MGNMQQSINSKSSKLLLVTVKLQLIVHMRYKLAYESFLKSIHDFTRLISQNFVKSSGNSRNDAL